MAYTTSTDFGLAWADSHSPVVNGESPQRLPRRSRRRAVTVPLALPGVGTVTPVAATQARGEVSFMRYRDYFAPRTQPEDPAGGDDSVPAVPDAQQAE